MISRKLNQLGIININGQTYISNIPSESAIEFGHNNWNAASGGQLLPIQNITMRNQSTITAPISINIRVRYDANGLPPGWDVDIYADIHPGNSIITHHLQNLHHCPDSDYIKVEATINGQVQPPIESYKPKSS